MLSFVCSALTRNRAAPNELAPGHAVSVDPDIDTLPLLAWSVEQLGDAPATAAHRLLIRLQPVLLFPILLFARVSWCAQSAAFPASGRAGGPKRAAAEALSIAAHYTWLLSASFALLPPPKALAFVALAELFCGVLLGFVFIQSHNGCEVYADGRDFVASQVSSTRNVTSTAFNDWFTGGLNRQVEHHLFPTLPRHNLGKAQAAVRELCAKHGLFYEECSMPAATARVLMRLAAVARAV